MSLVWVQRHKVSSWLELSHPKDRVSVKSGRRVEVTENVKNVLNKDSI